MQLFRRKQREDLKKRLSRGESVAYADWDSILTEDPNSPVAKSTFGGEKPPQEYLIKKLLDTSFRFDRVVGRGRKMISPNLIEGEKLVWAAAFADAFRRYSMGIIWSNKSELRTARHLSVVFACRAVNALRDAYLDKPTCGGLEEITDLDRSMLTDMLSETPKVGK